MLTCRKREAWDTVCEKKANQAYLDPAFVQPLYFMFEGFRLSSLRLSKLDLKSADIESGEVHTQWLAFALIPQLTLGLCPRLSC